MSPDDSRSTCWVISDGAAGNERQALALAYALDLVPRVLQLQLAHPWDWLAPRLTCSARRGMRDSSGRGISPPWPAIAIGCGRKAALLTRCLRDWSGNRCFTVQILDPRVSAGLFDAVVAPQHDQLAGANVIETLGALNAIDDHWLADGRLRFPRIGELPAPRIAILIGASHPALALDDDYFDALRRSLFDLHGRIGGSFLVSTSRRTPPQRSVQLRKLFSQWPGMFWADPTDGANPYAGMLAWADRIVVSGDSVNMISEACATGKPVHAFAPEPLVGKLGAFHAALWRSGHLSPLHAESPSAGRPLRELSDVMRRVRRLWQSSRSDDPSTP